MRRINPYFLAALIISIAVWMLIINGIILIIPYLNSWYVVIGFLSLPWLFCLAGFIRLNIQGGSSY